MSTQGKLALAAAVLLGGAWGFYGKGSEATTSSAVEPREEAVVTRELPRSDETITVVQTPSTGEHREVALEPEVPAPAQTVPVAEPAETQVVRGHVVDVSGTPVPGARVAMGNATQKERPTTDGSGWFEARFLPASPEESDGSVDTYTLRAEAEGWVTVRESVVRPNNLDRGHVVVVARTLHAEGWVRDTEGQPIEGARLSSNPIAGAFYNSAYVLDLTRSVGFGTTTDAQGHFSMEEFPQFPGSQFIVHAKGYLSRVIPIDGAAWPLQVELVRPQEEDIPSIQGIVRDELGLAVEGATVHLSRNRTQSDASGWFRLPLVHDYIADQTPLCATKPGHQAALIAGYGERLKSELPLPASVELTLGPEPLSISGKLLDPDGLPWPGWIVTVLDGTEISQHMVPIISAEQYSGMGTKRIITTDRGAFQIHGLFDREYLIQAYDPETLQVVSSHFRGGENDAVLQTPRVAPRLLRARVVDSQGQPVPNTRLSINLKTQTIRGGFTSIGGRSTVAGDDGRFQLEFIPHDRLYLNYSGEHIIPGNLVLDGSLEEDIQELVAARRCHFLIELPAGWEHVTRAQLLDAGGERLMLHQYQSGSASSFPSARAKNGKFMQLAVSDAARTLVLFEGEQEVHRVPITLTGEGVQVLRP